jgi:hypothetical protein
MVRQLKPKPVSILRVFADEKRHIALRNAGRDKSIGKQMRVRSGEPEALLPVLGDDFSADYAPMRDRMG